MNGEAENENRRRIDKLQGDFEKSEIERKADKKIQEKNMQILESNIKEIIAENKAAFEKSLAENRVAFEKLRTTIEKQGKWQMVFNLSIAGFVVAVVMLGIGALGLYWQYLHSGGG